MILGNIHFEERCTIFYILTICVIAYCQPPTVSYIGHIHTLSSKDVVMILGNTHFEDIYAIFRRIWYSSQYLAGNLIKSHSGLKLFYKSRQLFYKTYLDFLSCLIFVCLFIEVR